MLGGNLEVLVRRLKQGDETAFTNIYNQTYRQIFFVILPITRDKFLAEDIIQETYLKFLQKLEDYKTKNLLSYLITIAKNLAINEYNRRKKVTKVEDFDEFSYYDYVEFKTEAKEAISKALSVLDKQETNIFLLHVLENLTHKEIAVIMDKPIGTITWLYSRAIKKMQNKLKGDNYEF
jgi:RNA polymerase sigma-70 factor, ECF subfamily